jgi:hypothetical protein
MDICRNCQWHSPDDHGGCLNESYCACSLCGRLDPGEGAKAGCEGCRGLLEDQARDAEVVAGWDDTP